MTPPETPQDVDAALADALPHLRRYARALTGAQNTGDRFAAAALEAVIEDPGALARQSGAAGLRVGLFAAFHAIWESAGAPEDDTGVPHRAAVRDRLKRLTKGSREVLLLHTLEEFTLTEVARIMAISVEEAAERLDIARGEMADALSGRVLVIEDEPIIAMDLEAILADMGHRVTGVARTADRARELGQLDPPDLVLADIHLADGSSGIDAVQSLLAALGPRPAIFITAYPERLLTGARTEPTFLIAKPYNDDKVRAAIAQAMLFAPGR